MDSFFHEHFHLSSLLIDSFKRNEGEICHSSMGSTTCRQLIWSQIFHSRTFESMEMADFSQVCSKFFLWHLPTTGESGPSLEDTFSFSRRLCRRLRSSSDLGNPLESWSPTTEIWRGKQAIPKVHALVLVFDIWQRPGHRNGRLIVSQMWRASSW